MRKNPQLPPQTPRLDRVEGLEGGETGGRDALAGAAADAIATALASADHAVLPGWLPADAVRALHREAEALAADGALAPAAIGRADRAHLAPAVRGDRTRWLDALDAGRAPALHALAATLDALRVALNRRTLLGLEASEAHLACYPPGARYARHLDRFADDDARVLSLVVYINPEWPADAGGELRLHLAGGPRDVRPEPGTVVAFLSAAVAHEVLPATRSRWSVAAWFRRRA